MHPYWVDRIQLKIHTINLVGFSVHLVAVLFWRVAAVLCRYPNNVWRYCACMKRACRGILGMNNKWSQRESIRWAGSAIQPGSKLISTFYFINLILNELHVVAEREWAEGLTAPNTCLWFLFIFIHFDWMNSRIVVCTHRFIAIAVYSSFT